MFADSMNIVNTKLKSTQILTFYGDKYFWGIRYKACFCGHWYWKPRCPQYSECRSFNAIIFYVFGRTHGSVQLCWCGRDTANIILSWEDLSSSQASPVFGDLHRCRHRRISPGEIPIGKLLEDPTITRSDTARTHNLDCTDGPLMDWAVPRAQTGEKN